MYVYLNSICKFIYFSQNCKQVTMSVCVWVRLCCACEWSKKFIIELGRITAVYAWCLVQMQKPKANNSERTQCTAADSTYRYIATNVRTIFMIIWTLKLQNGKFTSFLRFMIIHSNNIFRMKMLTTIAPDLYLS